MQCPNCGRTVRSKNQCAYCGHVFNKDEVSKAKNHDEVKEDVVKVTPIEDQKVEPTFRDARHTDYDDDFEEERTARRSGGGFGRVLWGIIKLIIVVALVFLAFLFGPRLINNVVEYFQPSETEVTENQPENAPEDTETPAVVSDSEEDASTEVASTTDTESEATSETESSDTAESNEESESESTTALSIANQDVNLDEYPMINVVLDFDQPLNEVNSETFQFTVDTNGQSVDLADDYSLVKEGQSLSISFNDPAVALLTTEAQEQTLNIASETLGINEAISYELPSSTLDSEQAEFFNTTMNDNLASVSDVSAVVASADANIPFVYDNQSVDADSLISWFVLGHTYNAINSGEITAEDTVTVNADLQAENETSTVSTAEEGTEFTVNELMVEVVHNGDVSAMNHLIQATGGPNAFNLWLNESNYFATKVTRLLGVQEDGQVIGAVTSAQDIAQFLDNLANDELISEELDGDFKTLLLDSPVTEKYPTQGIEGYSSRYEIANSDTNAAKQYYSGIIELEDTYYIAVVLASNFSSTEEVVPAISNSIRSLVTYFNTGQTVEEMDATAAEEAAAAESASIAASEEASRAAAESAAAQASNDESQPSQGTVGQDGRTYSLQYVENIGSYVNLPEETVYDETTGQTRPAEWFFNESTQSYQYR